MTTPAIAYTENGSKARYSGTFPGVEGEAELTTSRVSATLVIADHTYVPDTMRGTGMGRALVERLIADSRSRGERIVPLCSFVRAHAQRHAADLSDIIQW